MKKNIKRCHRRDCKFHTRNCENLCSALDPVYDDDKKCKFYKKDVRGEENNEG